MAENMKAADFRLIAWNSLKGKWGVTFVITAVAAILGGVGINWGFLDAVDLINNQPIMNIETYAAYGYGFTPQLLLYDILVIVIGPFVNLGYCLYAINIVCGEQQEGFKTLFSRMYIIGKAILLSLLMSLFIVLWALLLIIPGIIAAYRYSMAPFIMAENPDVGIFEAINLSKQYMDGNKWRLFCLQLSFIGWEILAFFVPVIGGLFLTPYITAAEAAFYLDLKGQLVLDNAAQY